MKKIKSGQLNISVFFNLSILLATACAFEESTLDSPSEMVTENLDEALDTLVEGCENDLIIADGFDDNFLSPQIWTVFVRPSESFLMESEGQLAVHAAPRVSEDVSSQTNITTTDTYDLTDSTVSMQMTSDGSFLNGSSMNMSLVSHSNDGFTAQYRAFLSNSLIRFRYTQFNADHAEDELVEEITTSAAYDPVQYKFWQFRVEDNVFHYEVSSDQKNWNIVGVSSLDTPAKLMTIQTGVLSFTIANRTDEIINALFDDFEVRCIETL